MRRLSAITAAVLFLGGCSQSPDKAVKEAREAAASWDATLSTAERAKSSGELSTAFFNSIVEQALTSLNKEAQTARKSAGDSAAAPLEAVAARAAKLR
jgi:hypothetical protein